MSSSIPQASANLRALLTAAFSGQNDVQVHYGKSLDMFVAPKTVQILGWTGDQEPAELGPSYQREETFQFHMEIDSFAGDQDWATRESEVMALFGVISVLIANNWELPSTAGGLDGAVRFAEVGTFMFSPEATSKGQSVGVLTFDIHCSQRVDSLI